MKNDGMRKRWWPSMLVVLTVLAISLQAQDRPRSPRHGPPPDGFGPPFGQGAGRGGPGGRPGGPPFGPPANLDFLSSEIRMDGPTVKGIPYSATAITENIQTLGDGTRITNKTTAEFARDSEGRLRRELSLTFAGPFRAEGEAPRMILINDAVAGVRYMLDPQQHRVRKVPLRQMPSQPPNLTPPAGQSKTESLGKQMIEGIEVEGTRLTVTIPTGQIGNDRPIEIISERWESPELKIVVLSKHRDPRFGETVYRLNNIRRAEPARSLFEVPGDYKVEEGGPPPGSPMRPMRRPE